MKYWCLLALVACVQSGGEFNHLIKKHIDEYNFRVKCWGQTNVDNSYKLMHLATEKCMQQEPSLDWKEKLIGGHNNPFFERLHQKQAAHNPFNNLLDGEISDLKSLWRSKRAAAQFTADEDDVLEFIEDFHSWGETMATSLGNLTCVLKETKCLDEEGNINIEHYRNMDSDPEYNVEESNYRDPEFKAKVIEGINDCYKIQESFPQAALNGHPLKKVFGRHMIFFKCIKKVEHKMCAKAQMKEWLEKWGHHQGEEVTDEELASVGLPKDRYEAAYITTAVLFESATPEEKAIKEFFMGH